jgi:hypothetical protein
MLNGLFEICHQYELQIVAPARSYATSLFTVLGKEPLEAHYPRRSQVWNKCSIAATSA